MSTFVFGVVAGGCARQLWADNPRFNAVVLTERGGLHEGFVSAALDWLGNLAADSNFTFTVVNTPEQFSDTYLQNFQLVLQLNYPAFAWSARSMAAFEKFIEEGRGGWIGLHHASLYGDWVTPSHEQPWTWMGRFLGDIQFRGYIAETAAGTVSVEEPEHPCMRTVAPSFRITNDEWYTWDKNPRPNVRVLATVDESSYVPASDVKMGDHPVVWVNEQYQGRNVYILPGHHRDLLDNSDFTTLLGNSIFWATGQDTFNQQTGISPQGRTTPTARSWSVSVHQGGLVVTAPGGRDVRVELFTPQGRSVARHRGGPRVQLDHTGLAPGTYLISVWCENVPGYRYLTVH